MYETRSSIFKMLQDEARKDRRIAVFPKPYHYGATPYSQSDFNSSVREASSSVYPLTTGLMIAKAIVLGDVAVGKTSLVNRFCHQIFDTNYKATIGVDFEVERFDILGIPFNLQIWDTAGQERFKSIASSYYRGAHAVVLCFDMTNPPSLTHCFEWKKEAMKANSSTPYIFLVGTKRDLLRSRKSYKEVEARAIRVAKELEAEFWCASSRTGEGISDLFCRLAALTFDSAVLRSQTHSQKVSLGTDLVSLKRPAAYPQKHQLQCLKCP